jgi:hypothetical protein
LLNDHNIQRLKYYLKLTYDSVAHDTEWSIKNTQLAT